MRYKICKTDFNRERCLKILGILISLTFILFIHGAIPFVALPTLGQAVWSTGFSQSFINQSPFSIHAVNFGLPDPASIAFGLAGAYPAGLLIGMGLHPADAYAVMAAMWLIAAFFGAWRLCVLLGLSKASAVMAAVFWMSMPIIWAHAGFSMLSLGIALLPAYIYVSLKLIAKKFAQHKDGYIAAAAFIAACVIAVFMDGYTYLMFAVGVGFLGAFCFIGSPDLRRHLVIYALPVTITGFALSYFLYSTYIGKLNFEPEAIEMFRGWGLDLTFLALPTKGIHWLWDVLGLSVERSGRDFFGDASVWITTFSLPVIVTAIGGLLRMKKRNWLSAAFLVIALFGIYMALGPSLKVNSTRPEERIKAGDFTQLMTEEQAVMPTGNAILSKYIPGFQQMRAAYRWLALGLVGLWAIIVLKLAELNMGKRRIYCILLLVVLIALNLPHFDGRWQRAPGNSHLGGDWRTLLENSSNTNNRKAFVRMEKELVQGMRSLLYEGERAAFLPYRNDFLVNYIAARLNIRTFNIGGDKNLMKAREHWPLSMRGLDMGQIDNDFADRIMLLLVKQEVDAVVLPFIDMLWAAHFWPAPVEFEEEMEPVIAELDSLGFFDVQIREHYAVVRVAPEYINKLQDGTLHFSIMERQGSPTQIKADDRHRFALLWVLGEGWHDVEAVHVWSGDEAELRLPVADIWRDGGHAAQIKIFPHAASFERKVKVILETDINGESVLYEFVFNNMTAQSVLIPLTSDRNEQIVRISIPDAASPKALEQSSDPRVLGIALRSIQIADKKPDVRMGTVLHMDGFTREALSQVGSLKDSALVTTGREGFLSFGPYATMGSGKYRLVVKGTAEVIESAWVDVVSGSGAVEHARFELSSSFYDETGVLAAGTVILPEAVDDLEVRIYVGEGDSVRLDGYKLVPVRGEP